jgi:hypothetical protein
MRPLLLALMLVLVLPAAALAAPEDPPVEAVLPADGAALPTNPDGIEVRYTCPEPYRIAGESPFVTHGGRDDFGVYFSSSATLGNDGRLSQADLVAISGSDDVQDNDIPAGQCRGFMADPGNRPQTKPGTYYWQAWRTCFICPGGYETSPVRSFRLTGGGLGRQAGGQAAGPRVPRLPVRRLGDHDWPRRGRPGDAAGQARRLVEARRGRHRNRPHGRDGRLAPPVTACGPLPAARPGEDRRRDAHQPGARGAAPEGGRVDDLPQAGRALGG